MAAAARAVGGVLSGASLNTGLDAIRRRELRAAAQDLAFNALRGYGIVDAVIDRLLQRRPRDAAIRGLMLVALAELLNRPQSAYAVVHQAVEATTALKQVRSKGLVNAVLRNFLRQQEHLLEELAQTDSGRFHHPQWWLERVREAYPEHWMQVLSSANAHPPMTLRVNLRRTTVERYLEKLERAQIGARPLGAAAVVLERPCRTEALPGFAEGEVSIQDKGAQVAAPLLAVEPGTRVLDACAAPGGKAAHVLELVRCDLLALDISRERAARIDENFERLGLTGSVRVGDATRPETFWDGRLFDRILADMPCSGSGVVRRHPDIRWLRKPSDLAGYALEQMRILEALWPLLGRGGTLLYATCSVFPEENGLQMRNFLGRHSDAIAEPIAELPDGQLLPGSDNDGFFYALLKKGRT